MADQRTIRVQGHGEVKVAPDRARVTLGVHTVDVGAQAAVDRNSAAAQAVMDALKDAGVPEDEISTSQFNIYFNEHERTYMANNQITVRVADVGFVGRVLGLAIRAGANASGGISFELTDSSEAEAEALRRAVADVRSRAETLASSLSVALGDVISLECPPPSQVIQRPAFARFARSIVDSAPSVDVPVAGEQVTIPADVEVVYQIQEKAS